MINKEIIINKQTREITNGDLFKFGVDGENLQENIIFKFNDEFVDGTGRIEITTQDGNKSFIIATKQDETYTLPIKSIITKKGLNTMQLVITQGTNDEEIPVFKSKEFSFYIADSINAQGEAPEEYSTWIDIISEKMNEVDTLDINATKEGNITRITITKKDGTQETTNVLDGDDGQDGVGLQYNWNGTSLGVKREDETNYDYVNLKGDTGEPGAISLLIVNELPSTGAEGTLYFVPKQDTETSDIYDEYMWVNNAWELLGEKQITVDLSDYYTKTETNTLLDGKVSPTDYSNSTTGGTIKTGRYSAGTNNEGFLYSSTLTMTQYNDATNSTFVGKGTLENVLTGKGLVSNTDYATGSVGGVIRIYAQKNFDIDSYGRVFAKNRDYATYLTQDDTSFVAKGTLENVLNARIGDIDSALDTLNGEVIS